VEREGQDDVKHFPVLAFVAGLGAFWGAIGYAVLWGRISWPTTNRSFVVSPLGTAVFLPARIVLRLIRWTELAVGRPFDLADNNTWIGFAAAAVGASVCFVAAFFIRAGVRRSSASRRVGEA